MTAMLRQRRKTLLRLSTILSLLMMVGAALLPHAVSADSPFSHITPRSPEGRDIQSIYKLIFWMSLIVFVGVQAGIAYTALRYRRRSEDDERPEQVHGNKTLEIAWTILPAIVLLIIFIPTVRTIYAKPITPPSIPIRWSSRSTESSGGGKSTTSNRSKPTV